MCDAASLMRACALPAFAAACCLRALTFLMRYICILPPMPAASMAPARYSSAPSAPAAALSGPLPPSSASSLRARRQARPPPCRAAGR